MPLDNQAPALTVKHPETLDLFDSALLFLVSKLVFILWNFTADISELFLFWHHSDTFCSCFLQGVTGPAKIYKKVIIQINPLNHHHISQPVIFPDNHRLLVSSAALQWHHVYVDQHRLPDRYGLLFWTGSHCSKLCCHSTLLLLFWILLCDCIKILFQRLNTPVYLRCR